MPASVGKPTLSFSIVYRHLREASCAVAAAAAAVAAADAGAAGVAATAAAVAAAGTAAVPLQLQSYETNERSI